MASGDTSDALEPVAYVASVTRVEVEAFPPLHRKIVAETVLAYYVEGIPLETSLEGADGPEILLVASRRIVAVVDRVVGEGDHPDLMRDCLTAVRHTAEHPDTPAPES